jgi:hypothetical protein
MPVTKKSRRGVDGHAGRLAEEFPPNEDKPLKFSLNVDREIGFRLRRLAFEERLSESSIVEIALRFFFARGSDADLVAILRDQGATLRRKSVKVGPAKTQIRR